MRHAPFLKVTSRELRDGRMVDLSSVSVCHCGRRFSTEKDLEAHVLRPITDLIRAVETNLQEMNAAQVPPPAEIVEARITVD